MEGGAPSEAVDDNDVQLQDLPGIATEEVHAEQIQDLPGMQIEEVQNLPDAPAREEDSKQTADLRTQRGSFLGSSLDDGGPPESPPIALACHNIVRGYQLVPDEELDETLMFSIKDLVCPEVTSDLVYFNSI